MLQFLYAACLVRLITAIHNGALQVGYTNMWIAHWGNDTIFFCRYDGRLTEVIVYATEAEWVETGVAANVGGKEWLMCKTMELKSGMPAYVRSGGESGRYFIFVGQYTPRSIVYHGIHVSANHLYDILPLPPEERGSRCGPCHTEGLYNIVQ